MKKSIITITSALFAFGAVAQAETVAELWARITAGSSSKIEVSGDSTDNTGFVNYDYFWLKSGTRTKNNIAGSKKITIIGDEETGPNLISGNFFSGYDKRAYLGTTLGFSSVENNDLNTTTYIFNGNFYNKVSAVSYYNNDAIVWSDSNNNGKFDEAERNKLTGSLVLYGGSYSGDITGIGMETNKTFTANTEIQVLGNIKTSNAAGVFGGVSGQTLGYSNLFGNTKVSVKGNGKISFVVGGNRAPANLTGNTNVFVIDGGTTGGVMGGNYIHDWHENTSTLDGNVNITISNGNVGTISSTGVTGIDMNGIIAGGVNTSVTGTVKTDISGASTVKGGISAGSASWGTTSIKNTVLNISGGIINATGNTSLETASIANQIYGGSLAIGLSQQQKKNILGDITQYQVYKASDTTINEGTAINITGGTITGNIFGGGYAQGADATYYGKMTVNGGSQITVDAENDISIAGNIYGGGNQGSNGTSVVNGGTNVVFSNNDGKTLTFTGTVSGNGLNGAVVNGTKVFSFDNYNGAFGGTIENFDIVNIKTSNLTGNINLSSTASNVFVYGVSSIDSIINGMTSITIDKDAVFTIENSSLLDGVNLVNNGQLIIKNYDSEAGVEVKGELVVDESLSLDIGTETSAVVKSVENVTETFVEDFANSFVGESTSEFKAAAFDFDIVLEQGESVTLSFFVGDSELNAENFTIFHEQNGEWSQAEDVSNVKYEDGVLSFDVSHFSGYGYIATAVPEPAEWAMLLGSLALALAVYRRRK